MPRARRLRKNDRDRFVKGAGTIILAAGGIEVEAPHRNRIDNELHARYSLDTKYGPLDYLSVSGRSSSTGGPGDVMTRFRFAKLARSATGCNQYSGKWNHHYFDGWTTDTALEDLKRRLEVVRVTSCETFADETAIAPQAVASTVLERRGLLHNGLTDPPYAFGCGKGLQHDQSAAWFIQHADRRLRFLFDTNSRLNELFKAKGGLDTVYAFVEHWLDAYVDDQPAYRKKRSLLPT